MPRQLPAGPFPPQAGAPSVVGMDASGRLTFSMPEYQSQVDVTGQQIHVAPLPSKQDFSAGGPAAAGGGGAEYASRVPGFDQAGLNVSAG